MTKETEVTAAPPPTMVSSDRDDHPMGDPTEVVETVVIDPPSAEPRADIEDVISSQEDPRAEIYARHSEKRDQETDASGENDQIGVENGESVDIIDPAPDQSDTTPDSDNMVTVKVLGDYRQVPKEKVKAAGGIENYQIRIAAQEQMERNAHERAANAARSQALDERERRNAAVQAEIPAMDSHTGHSPDRSTHLDGQNLEAKARQYQEAVYDDAAEAPSILVDMVTMAANAGKQFDETAFRRRVKEDVLAEQRQAKIVKASHALIKAHPELNQRDSKYDPRLFTAIDDETVVIAREHGDWDPDEVVREAFDRIQKWKGSPQPKTMSDKQAQKRAMNRPRVGTQRYTAPPPPPRQTNSDYVQQERKRRGLE